MRARVGACREIREVREAREVREVTVVRDVTEVRVVSVLAVGGLDAGGLVCRQRILYRTDASETGS